MGVFGATKVLELAFASNGILKLGEREPGLIENPAIELDKINKEKDTSVANGHGSTNNNVNRKIHLRRGKGTTLREIAQEQTSRRNQVFSGFLDAAEALASLRGIGWQFGTGTGLYVPKDWRDTSSRRTFALQTLGSWLAMFTMFDVLTSLIKLVPGVGTTQGGSIFAFGSNVFEKYAISLTIEFATGVAFIFGTRILVISTISS